MTESLKTKRALEEVQLLKMEKERNTKQNELDNIAIGKKTLKSIFKS